MAPRAVARKSYLLKMSCRYAQVLIEAMVKRAISLRCPKDIPVFTVLVLACEKCFQWLCELFGTSARIAALPGLEDVRLELRREFSFGPCLIP